MRAIREMPAARISPGLLDGHPRIDGAGGSAYDIAGALGKGGIVQFIADPEVAKASRAFAVAFFVQHLRPGTP